MHIVVNGKGRDVEGEHTLLAFLEEHQVNPQLVAVEYNGDIVRRERFGDVLLQEGDKLEIVHMVGGGQL